jgi:chitin synthase
MAMSGYAGSVYGMPPMGMGMGMGSMGNMGMGMPPAGPRNSVATNLNMFGGGRGSAYGGNGAGEFGAIGAHQRPMSTFSMATTANPFASQAALVSEKSDPTDEELLEVLRHYLGTQDLMTVTKK